MSADEEERLNEQRELLAQKQNPTDVPKIKVGQYSNLSLTQLEPTVQLEPYTDDPKYTEPFDESEVKSTPISTQTSTIYQGRKAQVVTFEIAQPVTLQPNSEYIYPINRYEDGDVVHFTVAVNDPDIRVIMTLYDDSQKPDPLCSESANDLVLLGRGMTHAEAYATDVDGVSIDLRGQRHSVMPYVLRFKHTFSYGFSPIEYDTVAGKPEDKWFVIEFEPSEPAPYKRIFFTIRNPTQSARVIHYARVRRYAFQEGFIQQDALSAANPANSPLNMSTEQGGYLPPGRETEPITPASMARKVRISAG